MHYWNSFENANHNRKDFLDTVPDIPAYSLIKTVQVGYQTRNGFSHNKIANRV